MRRHDSRARAGMVLPLALAIMAMLAILALAVHTMSRQTYRSLGRIDGFLRAISVAEAGYARVVTRLEARPWEERWFRGTFATDTGVWDEGKYALLIADDGGGRADLVVRAEVDGGLVVLYWQLTPDLQSLSAHRRVRTTFFSHGDPQTPVDVPALTGIREKVRQAQEERRRNRPWSDERERHLVQDPRPESIPGILEIPGPPPPTVIPPLVDNGPGVPLGDRTGVPPDPPIPVPTLPPPPPDGLVTPPVIEQIALKLERLDEMQRALEALGNYLESTVGAGSQQTGSQVDSVVKKLQDKVSSCCPDPTPSPSPEACPDFKCEDCTGALGTYDTAMGTKVAEARNTLNGCAAELTSVRVEVERAVAPPGPTESQGQDLLARVNGAMTCVSNTARVVRDTVGTANTSLSPCGATGLDGTDAPIIPGP